MNKKVKILLGMVAIVFVIVIVFKMDTMEGLTCAKMNTIVDRENDCCSRAGILQNTGKYKCLYYPRVTPTTKPTIAPTIAPTMAPTMAPTKHCYQFGAVVNNKSDCCSGNGHELDGGRYKCFSLTRLLQ